ncbi:MAG: hypothetical protein QOH96_1249 [Blastocatellia bacterium]|nr:hypothetical protein [Blastocatellia bacterium]
MIPNKKNDDQKHDKSVAAGANPAVPGTSRGQRSRDTVADSGDPFIEDMTDVAGHTVMDGNAEVDSPQAINNSEGSPGNSR